MTLPVEIERRFRVNLERLSPNGEDGKPMPRGRYIKQAYLSIDDPVIRIRVVAHSHLRIMVEEDVHTAKLTAKGRGTIERTELNVPVPPLKALQFMEMAQHGFVEKVRYEFKVRETSWVVDRFLGRHEGLWLAEVELPSADAPFDRPPWLAVEVTDYPRFSNVHLAAWPFDDWKDSQSVQVDIARCVQCMKTGASLARLGRRCAVVCECGYRVTGDTVHLASQNWNYIAQLVESPRLGNVPG